MRLFSASLLLLLYVTCYNLHAQVNSISGTVIDSLTQEPLPFVNVFFANTSIGTATNSKGDFSISGFSSGKYDLTISFVGFQTQQRSLDFNGSTFKIAVLLAQESVQLSEILVKADTANWKQNFITFRDNFIGTTSNAKRNTIVNAKDIHLYFDNIDRVLVAHSKQHLVIDNRALGYRVHYQLVDFTLDYRNSRLQYLGIPRFEELKPTIKSQGEKWAKERKRAYEGSFTNLVQVLYHEQLADSRFSLFELHEVRNPERPSSAFLTERINYWRAKNTSKEGKLILSTSDSLSYYLRLRSIPELVDSVGKQIKNASEIMRPGTNDIIQYKNRLKIVFKEKEDVAYVLNKRRAPQKVQQSVVHFLADEIKIYPNGYFEDVRFVFLEGYLGWAEKIAEMLPIDYKPEMK